MSPLVYRHNRITRLTHWINALALAVLFMSGLQIFNAFPNLHWGSKAEPEEAFFSIYAADDEGEIRGYTRLLGWRVDTTGILGAQNTEMGPFPRAFPSWLTIPGYFWLAGGRRWHFFFAWIFALNGLLYFLYNLGRGHVRKFVFTPKDAGKIVPMILYYLRLRKESPQEGEYNPLQKLAYTGVFFILTPLIVLTGLAMSPQMDAAFNWLPALFGGRQSARTFHFLLTFLFAFFTFGHIVMVITTGMINNMRCMVTGWYIEKVSKVPGLQGSRDEENSSDPETSQPETLQPLNVRRTTSKRRALKPLNVRRTTSKQGGLTMKRNSPTISRRKILFGALQGAGFVLLSGCENFFNQLHQNKKVLSLLESAEGLNRRLLRLLTGRDKPAQEFSEKDISRYFKPNGNPPPLTMDYVMNAMGGWPSWKLAVGGLVKQPGNFSLGELKAMPARSQITRHDCVEGWSAIGKWKGVPLNEIMKVVQPDPQAKYVVFYCMDMDSEGNNYYESVDMRDASHPQTILAYEMNDKPLPVEHGAPLRLRVETQLGYKMAKYIQRIEFVESFKNIAQGKGGYWEDQGYEWYAGI